MNSFCEQLVVLLWFYSIAVLVNMAEAVYTRDLLNPQEYYARLGGDRTSREGSLKDRFHDIDDKAHFVDYMSLLQNPLTENFVLDFGNEDAWCATNLNEDELKLLLRGPVCRCLLVMIQFIDFA